MLTYYFAKLTYQQLTQNVMTKLYLFFWAPQEINHDTVFWCVRVGDSLRDRKRLDYVQHWFSQSWQAFFAPYSKTTSEYLDNIAKSLYPSMPSPTLLIKRGNASVAWLAKTIRQGNFADFSVPNLSIDKIDLVWNGLAHETDFVGNQNLPIR